MNYTNWKKDNFSLVPNLIWRQKKRDKDRHNEAANDEGQVIGNLEHASKFCAGDSLPDWGQAQIRPIIVILVARSKFK